MRQETTLIKKLLKHHFPGKEFSVSLREPKNYIRSGDIVYVRCQMHLIPKVKSVIVQNTVCCGVGTQNDVLSKRGDADVASIRDIDTGGFVKCHDTMLDFIIIKPLV